MLVEQRRWYNDELGWNPTQLPPFSVMVAGIVDHDLPRHPVTRARRTIVNPVPKADRLALEGMIQERGLKGPISYYTDRVLFN